MNTLTLVNKFCAHNNFMPDELYTEGSKVVVRYNTMGKYKEYARLISRTHNSNAFRKNNIETSDPDYTVMPEKEKKKGKWKHDADLVIHKDGKSYKIHKKTRSVKNRYNE